MVLQRFNKKDSATSEEPDERDLRDLIKFIEDDTLNTLNTLNTLQTPLRGIRCNVLYSDAHHDSRDTIQPSG